MLNDNFPIIMHFKFSALIYPSQAKKPNSE